MKSTFIFFLILVILFPFNLSAQEKKDEKTLTLYLKTDYSSLKINRTTTEILDVFIKVCGLIENANESDDPFLIFKEKKKELIQLLKNASGITQDLLYRKYLNSLSENILNDKYAQSYSDWLNIRERSIDIIIKPPEKQKKISFFLLKVDQIKSKKYEKYVLLIDKMMANSTMKNTSSLLRFSIENPFLFFDVLCSSTVNRFVFIHPDQLIEDQKNGSFKIIFCINIIKFYFEKILKPISELILDEQLKKFVEFDAYLSNLVMHRISHTLGPFNADSKSEDLISPLEKLKELFYCIEEIKADAVSICNTAVLLKEKLISEKGEKSIYVLFVLNLLEKIRTNPLDEEKKTVSGYSKLYIEKRRNYL